MKSFPYMTNYNRGLLFVLAATSALLILTAFRMDDEDESVFHQWDTTQVTFVKEAETVGKEVIEEPIINTHAHTHTRTINTMAGSEITVPVILDEEGNDIYPLTSEGFEIYTAACSRREFGLAPWDEDVLRWVRHFVLKSPKRIKTVLSRYGKWKPYIDVYMNAASVPVEMGCLCLVESGCTYNAISKAGAAGMWQFMPETARDYGLEVSNKNDERHDPVLLTQAAVQLLRELYDKTGDWLLTAASYNCGPGTVAKALKKAGTDDWSVIKSYLPEETRQYIPCMLAYHYVWTYREILHLK